MTKTATKKRKRRTHDELIKDLQAEIERLKQRAQAKKAKANPSLKHTTDAVRSIEQALRVADDGTLKKALQDAREPLVAYFTLQGLPVPKRRGRKSRAKQTA